MQWLLISSRSEKKKKKVIHPSYAHLVQESLEVPDCHRRSWELSSRQDCFWARKKKVNFITLVIFFQNNYFKGHSASLSDGPPLLSSHKDSKEKQDQRAKSALVFGVEDCLCLSLSHISLIRLYLQNIDMCYTTNVFILLLPAVSYTFTGDELQSHVLCNYFPNKGKQWIRLLHDIGMNFGMVSSNCSKYQISLSVVIKINCCQTVCIGLTWSG